FQSKRSCRLNFLFDFWVLRDSLSYPLASNRVTSGQTGLALFQKSNRFKLWNLTVPFKEITSACHCAIVIPTERSDEGSLFHYNRKYFVNPHLFATEPLLHFIFCRVQ
ncbi:MAG: hypothetical protein IKL56_06905, partial [Bacteroidaceae bacterium]|nr:hypothetical protein [Bacteroidaceae bacterium]